MAKYNMYEMNQARAEIKSWASDNTKTLNDKIKSLNEMINEKSNSSKVLGNIKDYASNNVTIMNSAVSGFKLLSDGIDNAVNAYNDDVGQDVDSEKINQKIEENRQLIYRITSQINSLPKDDITTSVFTFALNGNRGLLESINTTYSNLIEKFNNWNRKHRTDLDVALDVISDANKYIQELSTLSYDSKTGYNLDDIPSLQVKTVNDDLKKNGYITEEGEITDKGFKYLEVNFKRDYKSISPQDKKKIQQIMSYADTEEEFFSLTKAGYSKPAKQKGYYCATDTFKALTLTLDDELFKMQDAGIIEYKDYYNRLAVNHASMDLLAQGGALSDKIRVKDYKSYNKDTNYLVFNMDDNGRINRISFSNEVYRTGHDTTNSVKIDIKFYGTDASNLKDDAIDFANKDVTKRNKIDLISSITMDILTGGSNKYINALLKEYKYGKEGQKAIDYLVEHYDEIKNALLAEGDTETLELLDRSIDLDGGNNEYGSSESSNLKQVERKYTMADAMKTFHLCASTDDVSGKGYLSRTNETKDAIENFNEKIRAFNAASLDDQITFYNHLQPSEGDQHKEYYEAMRKDLFDPDKCPSEDNNIRMKQLEEVNIDNIITKLNECKTAENKMSAYESALAE